MLFLMLALIAGVMGAASYIQENDVSIADKLGLNDISLSPSGFFSRFMSNDFTNVPFEANLTIYPSEQVLLNPRKEISSIRLNYSYTETPLRVDGLTLLGVKQTTAIFKEFKGELSLGNLLSISGYSHGALINDLVVSNKNNLFYVKGENISVDNVVIENIPKIDFEINVISGTLQLSNKGDTVIYNIYNKPLDIEDYEGYISFDGDVLKLKGKGNIKSSTIITPKEKVEGE